MAPTEKLKRASKSVSEFCAAYHITRRTFEHWVKKGIGPAVTQPAGRNGRIIITAEAEDAWKRAHTALVPVIENAGAVSTPRAVHDP
jgi:hypothetical protein